MNKYKLLLILKNDQGAVGKVKEIFDVHKVKVLKEEQWGQRRFAYPIAKQDRGFYMIYQIEADKHFANMVLKKLEIEESVLRSILFK